MQTAPVQTSDDTLHSNALALPVHTHSVPERPHFGLGGQIGVGKEQLLHAQRLAVVNQRVKRLSERGKQRNYDYGTNNVKK